LLSFLQLFLWEKKKHVLFIAPPDWGFHRIMKKTFFMRVGFLVFTFMFLISRTFADTPDTVETDPEPEKPVEFRTEKFFSPALGLNLLSNIFVHLIGRYGGLVVGGNPWAEISIASMQENLTNPWPWNWDLDNDWFITNNFAHPYHGALYHTAARANGYNFYESYLFDLFGAATYELILETTSPSLNDLLVTSLSGAAMGEMMHRLYRETPSFAAGFISPMDRLSDAVLGRHYERGRRNINQVSVSSGVGWVRTEYLSGADFSGAASRNLFTGGMAAHVVYGDPFFQKSTVPYEHFELAVDVAAGGSPLILDMKIISDGYLFSFTPVNQKNQRASTGLSLHYDFFATANIDFFSQAVDWTLKYQRIFDHETTLELKSHFGGILLGSGSFNLHYEPMDENQVDRDYGIGINGKLSFSLFSPYWGKIGMDAMMYRMFISAPHHPEAEGIDTFCLFDLSYAFPLGKSWSLGIGDSFVWKTGNYRTISRTDKRNNSVKIFIQRSL
jgi:hypothetical protein